MFKKIEVIDFNIYGVGKPSLKSRIIDFTNDKVIITGGNGIGKTSFINLIVGILKNNSNWYKHVRYKEIKFHFNDKEPIVLKGSNIQSIKEIEDEDREQFNREISNIKFIQETIKKWIFIFKEQDDQEKIREALAKDFAFDSFFKEIKNILDKSDTKLNMEIQVTELNQVINCYQFDPVSFINSLVRSMKQNIDIINLHSLNKEANLEVMNKIMKKMNNNFEYFSIFRRVKEFIKNEDKNLPLEHLVPSENLTTISFEISKTIFIDIIKEFKEKIKNKVDNFRNNFFKIVFNNEWEENANTKIIEVLDSISKIANDDSFTNLCKNLKDDKFRKRVIGFISKIDFSEVEEIEKLYKKIKVFINKMNEVLNINSKEIIFKLDKFYLKNKKGNEIEINDVNVLSAGERQMFSFLYTFCVSEKELIIIDEPEISLSIRWQHILRNVIDGSLKTKKVLFITHSPYLISKKDIENKVIYRFDEEDEE